MRSLERLQAERGGITIPDLITRLSRENPVTAEEMERRALGGLLVRKPRWGLAFPAKVGLIVILIVGGIIAVRGIYRFLAITKPVASKVLVVEGWVHPYTIEVAAEEYKKGGYQRVFSTGGPVLGSGYVNDFQTSASVGADRLKAAGVPPSALQMVSSHVNGRDRTYSSAVALRAWLSEHHEPLKSFNVITEGAHGRRSRLMFEKAFGADVNIGVISVRSPDFDAKHWWLYSEGTEEIVQETIGYCYAKFLFGAIRAEQEARAARH